MVYVLRGADGTDSFCFDKNKPFGNCYSTNIGTLVHGNMISDYKNGDRRPANPLPRTKMVMPCPSTPSKVVETEEPPADEEGDYEYTEELGDDPAAGPLKQQVQ